ncbi:MAG: PQQ-binding-like beta-propeller repeat protein [Rhodospirillales bacterium]|nr:MAG: PQQ-binding-like beta-propeller repeat protein [Rhodospirillales bacterium]
MTTRRNRIIEGLKLAVFVLAVSFLAFVAGGVATFLKWTPVEDFMQRTAMVALYLYKSNVDEDVLDPFWHEAHLPGPESGNPVIRHDAAAARRGLNLFVHTGVQGATLIDMDGHVVHQWRRRFDEIWSSAPHIKSYRENDPAYWTDKIYWRRVHLFPNGDLLVLFESPYRTPYGFGLAKLDKDSNVLWKLSENAHHDTAIDPDGEIYVLTQTINEQGYPGLAGVTPPFIDDAVTILSANGEKRRSISILAAFLNSKYKPMLELLNQDLLGDIMHANTVQYVDAATAALYPFAEAGQLLISLREMNAIALLDPVDEKIVWADSGMWRRQHEPQMLETGRILLFDNQGHRGREGATRVIEYDPVAGAIAWSYAGTAEEPLNSAVYGSQQRLDNQNTLIVESNNGRAIEVTRDGRIVWEFRLADRLESDTKQMVRILPDLVRIDRESLQFLD